MSKTFRTILCLAVVSLLASSCVTQKKLTYLRGVDAAAADSINRQFAPHKDAIIKTGDALSILVSALDKEAVAPYNLPAVTFSSPENTTVQTTVMLQTYRVDAAGEIDFPVLGKIHVAGLTRDAVSDTICALLSKQVVNPMVQVNLIGARVSVMGEVNRPGAIGLNNGRLTLLEALASAGDLTPYGRRDNVLITRENNGKLEFARIDLTSPDLFASPYFYLQQYDVIYVSPNKVRAINSANVSLWLSAVGTLASAATVIVTVIKIKN